MDIEFVDNADASRFELRAGDEVVGFLDYRLRDDHVTMVHTEVGPAHSGHATSYVEKHPEYADLFASEDR